MLLIFVAGCIAGCIAALTLIYILACFEERTSDGPKQLKPPKQSLRVGSPVIVTEGPYQGMYGTIIGMGQSPQRLFVHFPAQAGTESVHEFLDEKVLRVNVPKEAIEEAHAHDLA
jgi:hypothetical protein